MDEPAIESPARKRAGRLRTPERSRPLQLDEEAERRIELQAVPQLMYAPVLSYRRFALVWDKTLQAVYDLVRRYPRLKITGRHEMPMINNALYRMITSKEDVMRAAAGGVMLGVAEQPSDPAAHEILRQALARAGVQEQ